MNDLLVLTIGAVIGIVLFIILLNVSKRNELFKDEIMTKERFQERMKVSLRGQEETYSEIYEIIIIKRTYESGRIELIRKRINYT